MRRFDFQFLILVLFCSTRKELAAQGDSNGMSMPFTNSVFSELVSLPNFRGFSAYSITEGSLNRTFFAK
jgi:hypothetical protein